MSCIVCKKSKPDDPSPFVKGSNYFRLESVKQHESSKMHLSAIERSIAKQQPAPESKAAHCLYTCTLNQYNMGESDDRALRSRVGAHLLLVDLLRALPPTSVKNETTFSAMKLMKTKRRGRMSASRVNDLMMIHLQSEDIEKFDPDEAIKNWMITPSRRKRRVEYTRQPTDKAKDQDTASDPVTIDHVTEEPAASGSGLTQTAQMLGSKYFDSDDEEAWSDDDETEMSESSVFSLLMSYNRE